MRQQYTLDSTALGQAINLPWAATTVLILNPTAKTLYIRVGGNDIPQSADAASITCPAGYAMAWPCTGPTFGVGFGLPQLAVQPDGMPTTATIYFLDATEAAPSFAPMPLDTLQAAITNTVNVNLTNANIDATITNSSIDANITNSTVDVIGLLGSDTLLSQSGSLAAGPHSFPITLPAGARGILLALGSAANVTALSITGAQTGFVYLSAAPQSQPSTAAGVYRLPVLSLDTSVTVALTVAAGLTASFDLWSVGGLAQAMLAADGPLLTRPTPPPLSYYKKATSGDVAVPAGTPGFGGGFAFSALPGTNCRIAAAQVTASATASAGQMRVRVSIKDSGGAVWATLVEAFSSAADYISVAAGLDVPLPSGFFCVGEYLNNDTVARFASVSAVLVAQGF